LSLDGGTGEITGVPTTLEEQTPVFRITDSIGDIVDISCSMITTDFLVGCPTNVGTVGVAYDSFVVGIGGAPPYTFYDIDSGSLPTGLSINNGTGEITGIPTIGGDYSFIVLVIDSLSNVGLAPCSINIEAPVEIGGGDCCCCCTPIRFMCAMM